MIEKLSKHRHRVVIMLRCSENTSDAHMPSRQLCLMSGVFSNMEYFIPRKGTRMKSTVRAHVRHVFT